MKTRVTDFNSFNAPNSAGSAYPFGLTPESMAKGLRKLADEIEHSGNFLPQSVVIADKAAKEDFTGMTITIELAEALET